MNLRYLISVPMLMLLVSGCEGFGDKALAVAKGAGTVTIAAATFPLCRAEWEAWASPALKEFVAEDYQHLDNVFNQFMVLVDEKPEMTLTEGLLKLVDIPKDADALATAFTNLETASMIHAIDTNTPNEFLKKCSADLKGGWAVLGVTGLVSDFIEMYGPYAKAAVVYKPLLDKAKGS